ncbi:ESX secretion-associated protein EspG [Nocardia mangyaensis]|uniref:ESX secretion-associated protein EspG n=1 Tax=Nocardia mangyaensis TaxID=2213200 RepID=UPI002674FC36|nr:ESX secretion-associated protein EspG [Nocardia mangyaensis]MDO3647291.1 ESX secretion-associated protein EspG [Nocardia mangyaensis]
MEFTPVEFAAMWDELREEGLPEPLTYLAPARTHAESVRDKRQAWQALRQRYGGELDLVTATLSRPDIRVMVRGIDGRDPANAKRVLRILAVRRGDHAYIVSQQPGEKIGEAAGFTLAQHEVLSLGDAVAAAFPVASAGNRRDFEIIDTATSGMDFAYGRSLVHDDGDRSSLLGQEFLAEPEDLTGTIEIEQGWSRFGPRGVLRLYLVWRDVVDDGRYVIVPGSPMRAVSADRKRLAALINTQIAEVVRAIRDDRA